MKYIIDDVALFDIFHTLSDMLMIYRRTEKILKHIAGLPVDAERRKDTSYTDHVQSMYQSEFGITLTPKGFGSPELKIVRPENWERQRGKPE
jgi:hypothetical protein